MRTYLLAFLMTCAVMGISAQSMLYSDLEMLGMRTCPHQDSCRFIRPGNFTDRNCECDDRCSLYNDCCIDAPAPRNPARTSAVCMPFGAPFQGAYVEATCPNGLEGPLVTQCQSDDFSDPFLSTPVTDARNGRTYLNYYCAQCNGAAPQLQRWNASVVCPGASNFTIEDVARGPGGWVAKGHSCRLSFDMPPGLSANPRLCRANLIDTCKPNWRRRTYKKACKAYLSVVVGKDRVLYRNIHCALCNGNKVDDVTCFSGVAGRRPFSFAHLLDVNRSDGEIVGVSQSNESCPNGQKHDPFFKKCRPLVCAIPGYKLMDGKCVKK